METFQGESQEMLHRHGSKVFICSDVNKSGSSLCVNMDFGLTPTPIMENDEVKESLIRKKEDDNEKTDER